MMQHRVAFFGISREYERPVPVFYLHGERILRFAVQNLERGDTDATFVILIVDRAVLAEFITNDFMPAGGQCIQPGFDVPFVNTAQMADNLVGARRPPNLQRRPPAIGPATNPEMIEPADMIDVVMGQEHFFDRGEGDFQRREILRGARAAIEQELVVAGFHEHRCASLPASGKRSSRAEKRDADFIFGKRFARIVVLAGHDFSFCGHVS